MFAIIALIITITAVAAGSVGGGSGGGSSPPSSNQSNGGSSNDSGGGATPTTWQVSAAEANAYRTAEYNAQWSLEAIHAAEAYTVLAKNNKTIAGQGVEIAFTDSGIQSNNIEISANFVAADSYNYVANNNTISDVKGHGTYSASIAAAAKDGEGIHGVAYEAGIVSSYLGDNVLSVNVDSTSAAISGAAAKENVRIINASWKYGSYTTYNGTPSGTNSSDRKIITAINAAQSKDVLIIAATGDDADNAANGQSAGQDSSYLTKQKPQKPALLANNNDLAGYVLAVGAVSADNIITDTSNICGIANKYCLVAPGANIVGASSDVNNLNATGSNGQKYATLSNSSAAAAEVSGAAAIIRAAWPHLTAPQVANILLTTATDLGDVGVDNIYGHGLLNLYAAVQAQGSNNFAYGASVNSQSYNLQNSSFVSDAIFGDAFTHNIAPALQNAVFFDDYGRDYKANLGAKISARGNVSAVSINNILLNEYKSNNLPISFTTNNGTALTQVNLQVKSYSDNRSKHLVIDKSQEDKTLASGNGFSLAQNFSKNSRLAFAFNVDELRNSNFVEINNFNFISQNNFAANTYQSFINRAFATNVVQRNFNQIFLEQKFFNNKFKLGFSYQDSYNSSSLLTKSSAKENQISNFNFSYTPNFGTTLAFSLGSLNEFNNNFLNSQALGAFGAGGNAKTSYFKFSASKKLFNNFSLIGSFSEGVTKAQGNDIGIFRSYSNIRSRSSSLGLVNDAAFGGRLGIIYSEPLRVYSGKALVDIPIARDNSGNVLRYNASLSLKPQGKERDFEFFYAHNLNKNNAQISFNFVTIKDAGNIKSAKNAYLGLVNYGLKF